MICDGRAADRLGGSRRHIVGVLHRFEPDNCALSKAAGMRSAIADGIDIGQRGLAERINRHAVAAFGSGGEQRCDRGDDADADDYQIGSQHSAIGELHAVNVAICAGKIIDHRAGAQIDAVCAVLGFEECR